MFWRAKFCGGLVAVLLVCYPQARLEPQQVTGRLISLRVHELSAKSSGPAEESDVVIALDSMLGKTFSFQIITGSSGYSRHKEMLKVLEGAFKSGRLVTVKYTLEHSKENGVLIDVLPSQPVQPLAAPVGLTVEDPVLHTRVLGTPQIMPPAPPVARRKGAPEVMEHTRWLSAEFFDLAPGQTHVVNIELVSPSVLLVTATCEDVGGVLKVLMDSAVLEQGRSFRVSHERETLLANVIIKQAGKTAVLITNRGITTLRTRLVVGTLPLPISR